MHFKQHQMSAPPKPLFVFFGIDGGATCCHLEGSKMFIGSLKGKVLVYNVETKVLEGTAHADDEERRIQSVHYSDDQLFVHIRGHAILTLGKPASKNAPWKVLQSVEVDHIGFCNSLLVGPYVTFVSADEDRFPLLSWFPKEIDQHEEPSVKATRVGYKTDNTPMHMTRGKGELEVIIAMEDGHLEMGHVAPVALESGETIDLGKEPVFCVASCSKWIVAGCAKAPIYLIPREDRKARKEVFYPPDAAGCSAITFSPNEKQILAGFWDGSIRVFSCLRLTILLALSSTHSSSITSLTWRRPEEGEVIVATSSDSTVSMWKLR